MQDLLNINIHTDGKRTQQRRAREKYEAEKENRAYCDTAFVNAETVLEVFIFFHQLGVIEDQLRSGDLEFQNLLVHS